MQQIAKSIQNIFEMKMAMCFQEIHFYVAIHI